MLTYCIVTEARGEKFSLVCRNSKQLTSYSFITASQKLYYLISWISLESNYRHQFTENPGIPHPSRFTRKELYYLISWISIDSPTIHTNFYWKSRNCTGSHTLPGSPEETKQLPADIDYLLAEASVNAKFIKDALNLLPLETKTIWCGRQALITNLPNTSEINSGFLHICNNFAHPTTPPGL